MGIRFPQRNMADRVTDRIMRIAAQQRAAREDKVAAQGAQLDAALGKPVDDVASMEGIEDLIVLRSLGA